MTPRWIAFVCVLVVWIIGMAWKLKSMDRDDVGEGVQDCFEIFGLFGIGAGALIVFLILNLVLK